MKFAEKEIKIPKASELPPEYNLPIHPENGVCQLLNIFPLKIYIKRLFQAEEVKRECDNILKILDFMD